MAVRTWLVLFVILAATALARNPPVPSAPAHHPTTAQRLNWCDGGMVSDHAEDYTCQAVALALHMPGRQGARSVGRYASERVRFTLEEALKESWSRLIYGNDRQRPSRYEIEGLLRVNVVATGTGRAVDAKAAASVTSLGVFRWLVVVVSCPRYGDVPYWSRLTLSALRRDPGLLRDTYESLYGSAFFDDVTALPVPEFAAWMARKTAAVAKATSKSSPPAAFDAYYRAAATAAACPQWSAAAAARTTSPSMGEGGDSAYVGSGATVPALPASESAMSMSGAGPLAHQGVGGGGGGGGGGGNESVTSVVDGMRAAANRPSSTAPSRGEGSTPPPSPRGSPGAALSATTAARNAATATVDAPKGTGDVVPDFAADGGNGTAEGHRSHFILTTAVPLVVVVVAVTMIVVALTARYYARRPKSLGTVTTAAGDGRAAVAGDNKPGAVFL